MPEGGEIVQQPRKTTSGLAVASLVLGILAVLTGWIVVGGVLGILAIIFGAVSLSRIKKDPSKTGKGMAIAGLITGIIGVIITVVVLFLVISTGFLGFLISRLPVAIDEAMVSEAEGVVKKLWVVSQTYYYEYGHFPVDREFQLTDEYGWASDEAESLAERMGVSLPSGERRFNFYLLPDGGAKATPNLNARGKLRSVTDIVIDGEGNISGGLFLE